MSENTSNTLSLRNTLRPNNNRLRSRINVSNRRSLINARIAASKRAALNSTKKTIRRNNNKTNVRRSTTITRNNEALPSIGIISINAESQKFPSEITDLFKEKFKSFIYLDIIIVGLQEDKPGSNSDKFITELFSSSHILINSIYMRGYQATAIAGMRILFLLLKDIDKKNIKVETFKVCNNDYCPPLIKCCSKGLVAVKFNNFTIINSHLAMGLSGLSFSEGVKKRVSMIQTLFMKLNQKFQSESRTFNIDTEHMIWFGDLNFRVSPQHDDNYQEIIDIINSNMISFRFSLLLTPAEFNNLLAISNIREELKKSFDRNAYKNKDELLTKVLDGKHNSLDNNIILPFDLHEAPINFNPTCKLVKGEENKYDVLHEGKLRLPSWCDRILFNSKMRDNYDVIVYDSLKFPIRSDHNSVFAIFRPKDSNA